MKKRLFALMLVVAMVLGMNTVAFAADGDVTTSGTIKKVYNTDVTKDEKGVYPVETLEFAVVGNGDNKPVVTVNTLDTNSITANETNVTYNVVASKDVELGKYEYTISEKAGNLAGVTYGPETIKIQVFVFLDGEGNRKVESNVLYADEADKEDQKKNDTITNEYEVGSFTVAKDVQGNQSKVTDEFTVNVTLTSAKAPGAAISVAGKEIAATVGEGAVDGWKLVNGVYTYTTELTISENDGVQTFANIPHGVSVKVEETGLTDGKVNGYTYKEGNAEFVIGDGVGEVESKAVVIVNEKADEIDTGIIVNNMPYIVALVVLAAAAVVFFRRRREF